eukprot:TRINITY_DN5918_c0_g1_i3.p1 TRINITY_DN5918_c0_g1~~TRINITY_DN5918_c0_g1_i3.p1  ORF type:complete len:169 (-),score=3.43 TRINITY_DN5918_c0_g1_i3:610-1116(-)
MEDLDGKDVGRLPSASTIQGMIFELRGLCSGGEVWKQYLRQQRSESKPYDQQEITHQNEEEDRDTQTQHWLAERKNYFHVSRPIHQSQRTKKRKQPEDHTDAEQNKKHIFRTGAPTTNDHGETQFAKTRIYTKRATNTLPHTGFSVSCFSVSCFSVSCLLMYACMLLF